MVSQTLINRKIPLTGEESLLDNYLNDMNSQYGYEISCLVSILIR